MLPFLLRKGAANSCTRKVSVAARGQCQSNFSTRSGQRALYLPPKASQRRQTHATNNKNGGIFVLGVATIAGAASAVAMARMEAKPKQSPQQLAVLRSESFPLIFHSHGKAKVRVLKVVKDEKTKREQVYEYTVQTTLLCSEYEKCYTNEDNTDLVATDTQKNTVYYVAQQNKFDSPEKFGILLCQHFLKEYPILDGCEVQISQVLWQRIQDDHIHGFVKNTPETYDTKVVMDRSSMDSASITSFISKWTILKTTQSGFEGYLQDEYTLLPPTNDRCLATELDAKWTFTTDNHDLDYNKIRSSIQEQLSYGIFGPPKTGVYSASLQATIYDAACLVLSNVPDVESITIHTPNLHYLPTTKLLQTLKDKKVKAKGKKALTPPTTDGVFIPTSEPSGIITCTVARNTK